jgi:hypothetical protein
MESQVHSADFSKLDKTGVAAAKLAAHKVEANKKADLSVEHSVLRKDKMPLTPADMKRSEKLKREVTAEDSAWKERQEINRIKRICGKYVAYFSDKYPDMKKASQAKPPEAAGREDWQDYLDTLANVIGSQKAGERFDNYVVMAGKGVEYLNVAFPDMFGGQNLVAPVSLAATISSPAFLASIDDEKHEIIFTHDAWFSSSKWSRIGSAIAQQTLAVANANKQASTQGSTEVPPEVIEKLAKMGKGRGARPPAKTPEV